MDKQITLIFPGTEREAAEGKEVKRSMDKQITLIFPGTEREAAEGRDVSIRPGITPADLLRAAGRDPQNWQIQIRRGDGFVSLGGQDDLYRHVEDGEKVFVVPKDIVVG